MALDFDLELATPVPVQQVAAQVHAVAAGFGVFDSAVTAADLLDGTRTVSDMWVRVLASTTQPRSPVAEDFGFMPTVRVTFRLGKFTDTVMQQDDMARLCAGVLERVPGDAVLHFQFEVIWLLRRNGVLTLNERDDVWRPERLAAVHLPYQRATHTFE